VEQIKEVRRSFGHIAGFRKGPDPGFPRNLVFLRGSPPIPALAFPASSFLKPGFPGRAVKKQEALGGIIRKGYYFIPPVKGEGRPRRIVAF
jgi:hypothetical protein